MTDFIDGKITSLSIESSPLKTEKMSVVYETDESTLPTLV